MPHRCGYRELVTGWDSLLEYSSRPALLQARVSGLILEPGACASMSGPASNFQNKRWVNHKPCGVSREGAGRTGQVGLLAGPSVPPPRPQQPRSCPFQPRARATPENHPPNSLQYPPLARASFSQPRVQRQKVLRLCLDFTQNSHALPVRSLVSLIISHMPFTWWPGSCPCYP